MARRWIRQELKKNEIAIFLEKTVGIFRGHRQTVFTTALMLIIFLVFAFVVFTRYKRMNTRAWERYAQGQSLMYQGKVDEAANFFDTFIKSFLSTKAAIHASLDLAEIHIRNKKFGESISILSNVSERAKKDKLDPYVRNKMAFSYLNKGDIDLAIENYEYITDKYPDHWLTASIYAMLARCYSLKGETASQREYLERLSTLYPGTEWAEMAINELKILSNQ